MAVAAPALSLAGRVCLVTGANRGIGLATAQGLAALGARVVLVARDQVAGDTAAAEIRRATGSEAVDLLTADLSSKPRSARSPKKFEDGTGGSTCW